MSAVSELHDASETTVSGRLGREEDMDLREKGEHMLVRGIALAFLAILGGCTTSKEMYLPDGSKGHNINCDGIANSMESCFQKAGDVCGSKGYSIASTQGSYILTRSLFIKCKE